ncbi:vma6 [Symbiodinium sp. KB8]|nr:vma6 [Symbiodinium sp. KB8]
MADFLFNINDGFADALLRGYRSTFLRDDEFHHLKQCKSVEDVRLNLQETDYGDFLQEESVVSAKAVKYRGTEKWVKQFQFLRAQAAQPMAQFLDFITYEYMIGNIMTLLKATMDSEERVDPEKLLDQCHPLGMFNHSTMKSILAFENSPQGYADLYATVLVDTPVGKYFSQYIKDQLQRDVVGGADEVRSILAEVPMFALENTLYKIYLEDFYRFCLSLGGETAEVSAQ